MPADVLGWMVVRDEDDGRTVDDWDGEIHPTVIAATEQLVRACRQEPLYEWYLAEARRTPTTEGEPQ